MTKDNFRALCEQVLVPRLGDIFYRYFAPLEEDIETVMIDVARMAKALDVIAKELEHANDV